MTTGAARSARLAVLLDPDAEVELLGSGFKFTEGPIWHPREKCLLFSDIAGDARHRWTEDGGFGLARRANGMGNGMTLDANLNLLVCEHATSTVVREGPDGTRTTVASHYQGNELNSPNDIVVRSDGSVYFTDPIYGRRPFNGIERASQLAFRGVYRIAPGGSDVQLVADDFSQPNGLCFSVDESLLYIDDTPRAHVRVFRVRPDGSLDRGELFATAIGDGTAKRWLGRRDQMRRGRQHLGHGTARDLGVLASRRAPRRHRDPRGTREPALGRSRLAFALRDRENIGLFGSVPW